jgi:hypothetical protein
MMGNLVYCLSFYGWSVLFAMGRAAWAEWLTIVGGWFVMTMLVVEGLAHPTDAVLVWLWINGKPLPSAVSLDVVLIVVVAASVAIGGLVLMQQLATRRLYRKSAYEIPLWPLALLVGVVNDVYWWWGMGAFDAQGATAGFVPAIVTALLAV